MFLGGENDKAGGWGEKTEGEVNECPDTTGTLSKIYSLSHLKKKKKIILASDATTAHQSIRD